MKKIIYTFMIFTIISTIGYAQGEKSSLIWGSRLALNYSSFGGGDAEGFDVKVGATFGVFARILHLGNFYLQPEFNYASKGVSELLVVDETITIDGESFETVREYDFISAFTYLEFPLLLKYNFGIHNGSGFKPEIFAGPFAAMKLNSELTVADDVTGSAVDIEDVNGLDYGLVFGAGFGVAIENIDFLFELRWTYSFPSFDKSSEQLDLNHRVFSLSLGFAVN
ncbi:porin family protein [Bacteroidota bacterium]